MYVCFTQALNVDLLWNYLDFRLEIMVIGVPRKGSGSAKEEGLGFWTSAALGLAETNWKKLGINQINKN